jgi:hypothetical protein
MLGVSLGSRIIKNATGSLRLLQLLEIAAILLFISSALLLRSAFLFFAMNLLCGMLAGMQFITANLCMKGDETSSVAGRLYAADLAGSFCGSILSSILLIPMMGVQNMLLTLVSLKVMSFVLLLSVRHAKN